MLKRIIFALSTLSLTTAVYAGSFGNEVAMPAGIDLIAPDSAGIFSVGIEALYAETANDNFTYAQTRIPSPIPGLLSRIDNEQVKPSLKWGGTLDINYLFRGNSRDVKLSWTHFIFRNRANASIQDKPPGTILVRPISVLLPPVGTIFYAGGREKRRYDSLDFVYGQWIKSGERLDLHGFGGLRYTDLRSDNKARYLYSPLPGVISNGRLDHHINAKYNGLGPRFGIDTAVRLGYGFSIVGTFAGAVELGKQRSSVLMYTPGISGAGGITGYTTIIPEDSKTAVVPELDGRIGLDYLVSWNSNVSTNLQIGYQVQHYFHITEMNLNDLFLPDTNFSKQDFGFEGPYFRLQLNVA